MIIDDIFHKEERDYKELRQVESQFVKIAFVIGVVNLFCWLVVGYLDPTLDSDLLFIVVLIFILFPPILSMILAVPIALIPYKDFNYQERFPRAWLLVMIVFLSAMTALGFFALVMENFNF